MVKIEMELLDFTEKWLLKCKEYNDDESDKGLWNNFILCLLEQYCDHIYIPPDELAARLEYFREFPYNAEIYEISEEGFREYYTTAWNERKKLPPSKKESP